MGWARLDRHAEGCYILHCGCQGAEILAAMIFGFQEVARTSFATGGRTCSKGGACPTPVAAPS